MVKGKSLLAKRFTNGITKYFMLLSKVCDADSKKKIIIIKKEGAKEGPTNELLIGATCNAHRRNYY